jgi:hydrogenase maturation protein HypF
MWVEQLARCASSKESYPLLFIGRELDFRPLLQAVALDRVSGRNIREIARSFQRGIAQGLCDALNVIARNQGLDTVVLSGGVFQNELLLEDLKLLLTNGSLQVWTNHAVPPNDGGISLGQAALAAFGQFDTIQHPSVHPSESSYA